MIIQVDLRLNQADFAKQIARPRIPPSGETRGPRRLARARCPMWFLSGRTQKAADVFLRLSASRQPDATLDAFLEAFSAPRVLTLVR